MNDLLHAPDIDATNAVECLGQTFPNDDARRAHFLKLLAEKLKDPEFRNQEGWFPQGTDEAILAMSDPPLVGRRSGSGGCAIAYPPDWSARGCVTTLEGRYDQTARGGCGGGPWLGCGWWGLG